jgi:hypothetical protein
MLVSAFITPLAPLFLEVDAYDLLQLFQGLCRFLLLLCGRLTRAFRPSLIHLDFQWRSVENWAYTPMKETTALVLATLVLVEIITTYCAVASRCIERGRGGSNFTIRKARVIAHLHEKKAFDEKF